MLPSRHAGHLSPLGTWSSSADCRQALRVAKQPIFGHSLLATRCRPFAVDYFLSATRQRPATTHRRPLVFHLSSSANVTRSRPLLFGQALDIHHALVIGHSLSTTPFGSLIVGCFRWLLLVRGSLSAGCRQPLVVGFSSLGSLATRCPSLLSHSP